jgi:hypothetical protein
MILENSLIYFFISEQIKSTNTDVLYQHIGIQ